MLHIPTKKECYGLIREMGMMDHIVDHSEQVCRVAVCLAENLNRKGVALNHELIRASALLHDITKTRSFRTRENHAETGGQFLEERGFSEVGHIIAQHVKLDTYDISSSLVEAEIVNYADKRVLHDQIVLLKDRLAYILDRYGDDEKSRERILGLWGKSTALEKKIFSCLPFVPEALRGMVEANTK
jgi:putative nucleotidyltransferase with HDIG domain